MRTLYKIFFMAFFLLTAPAATGQQRIGSHGFTLPEGFSIEAACVPGLCSRPITATLDEEGYLYVSDSSGSNEKVEEQLKKRPHRILRLEDGDADGIYEKRTIFADRMMFPEGTLWHDGSLYVSAPPSIWKLTDTDGDGVCDQREEWFKGTLTGCANDLHGPYLGLDGWIYWCKGAFAEQTHARPAGKPLVTRAAHIFRRRPGTPWVESVMTGGMDNPVDVEFLPTGERFFTTTFLQRPAGGKRDGILHAVYGGVYGKKHGVIDGHPRTGELLPPLAHLGPAAPCGLTRYRSAVFGREYRNNLFACCFNLHKITRHELSPKGATFSSRDSDFLVSDNVDFHPTDILEDADGSLLVIDTGGWYKLCCPTSQLHKPDVLGAIYRIRKKGAERPADPRGLELDWQAAPSRLTPYLDDDRPAVRERARAELARRGSASELKQTLDRSQSTRARRNAAWSLSRIDSEEAREVIRGGLGDTHSGVRQASAHIAGLWRDAGAREELEDLLEDESAQVRRSAAEALGRLRNPESVKKLLAAAANSEDRFLEHSLIYALVEIAAPGVTRKGLEASSPRTQRAALVALDQMEGGGLQAATVTSTLASTSPITRKTAEWLLSRHPEWNRELALALSAKVEESLERPGDLKRVLEQLNGHPALRDLLDTAISSGGLAGPSRDVLLNSLATNRLTSPPPAWGVRLAGLLDPGDAALRDRTLTALARLRLPSGKELAAALLEIAGNTKLPTPKRLEVIAASPGLLSGAPPAVFEFVLQQLSPQRPVALREASIRALASCSLDRERKVALITRIRDCGPLEVHRLFRIFEKESDEKLCTQLLDSLSASAGRDGLRQENLEQWLQKKTPVVQKKGAALLKELQGDTLQQKEHLAALNRSLPAGDIRRGQDVFNSPKTACSSCHAIGYLGGRIGPDLTRIGQVRSELDLLEALVYPSLSIVRSYEPVEVITTTGKVHSGILREEEGGMLTIITGPTTRATISKTELAELRPGKTSIMPAGLDKQLSRQELADLLAFLKATKWK